MTAALKSNKVETYVRHQIVSGKWTAGSKVPSDNELSKRLDVSYMTVKTVLSRLAGEGLLHRKQRAGTRVSEGLSCGNIAMVFRTELLHSLGTDYYRSILKHNHDLIEADKYRCVLAAGQGETEEQFMGSTPLFDTTILKQTVGIISFEATVNLDFCKKMGIPVVYSTSAIPPEAEHCVFLDYDQMLKQGVSLLQEKGFEDFALVTMSGPESNFCQGFYSGLRNLVHNIPGLPDERIVWLPWGGHSCEGIYSSFRTWWTGLNRKPRALFFMDDAVCDVALRVITELRIKVPDELAILTQSIENRTFHYPVSLASLEFSSTDVVETTWHMLQDMINRRDGDKGIRLVRIPAMFKMGDSLGN